MHINGETPVGMGADSDLKGDHCNDTSNGINGPDGAANLIAELRMELQAAEEWAGEKVPELRKLKLETESQKAEVDELKEQLAVWKEMALKKNEAELEANDARVELERDELEQIGKKMEEAEVKAAKEVKESEKKIKALKENHIEELNNLKKEMRQEDEQWEKKAKTAWDTIKRLERDLATAEATKNEKEQLVEEMKNLTAIIQMKDEEIEMKEAEIAKMQKTDKTGGLEATVKKLKERERELDTKVEDISANLNRRIAILNDEKKNLGNEKRKAEDATKQLNAKMSDLETENAKMKAKLVTFEQDQWKLSTKASAQMEETEKEFRKQITGEMSAKVTNLEFKAKSSEAEINNLRSRLANAERELKGAKKKKQVVKSSAPATAQPQMNDATSYEEVKYSAVEQMSKKLKKIKTTDCIIAFVGLLIIHMLIFPHMWNMKNGR